MTICIYGGFPHLKICPDDVFWHEESIIDCKRVQSVNISGRQTRVEDQSNQSEEEETHSHCFNSVTQVTSSGHNFGEVVLIFDS